MSSKRPGQANMRVIGAGLPRTGTLSMCRALNMLGISTQSEIANYPETLPIWSNAYAEGGLSASEWDGLFGSYGYEACIDAPSCSFVKQLCEMYPDAKVIITTRDPDAWCRSLDRTVASIKPGLDYYLAHWAAPSAMYRNFIDFAHQVFWGANGIFPEGKLDPSTLDAYVKELTQWLDQRGESDRYLIYETRSPGLGWKAICPFLGVEEPDKEWPNVNASVGSENTTGTEVYGRSLGITRAQVVKKMKNAKLAMSLSMAVCFLGIGVASWKRFAFII